MLRLVQQRQTMALEMAGHGGPIQLGDWEIQSRQELCVGGAVFHGHGSPALQHHPQARADQNKGREGEERCFAAASIEGHAKAHHAAPNCGQGGPHLVIGLEHPSHFLRPGPPQAMGNQESPHLGRAGLASQDALDRLAGLSLRQPRAGALPAAELANQFAKAAKPCT